MRDRPVKEDHDAVSVDNLTSSSSENITHLPCNPSLQFIHHEITEPFFIGGPIDAGLHVASHANPAVYSKLPIHILKVGRPGSYHS